MGLGCLTQGSADQICRAASLCCWKGQEPFGEQGEQKKQGAAPSRNPSKQTSKLLPIEVDNEEGKRQL